MPTATSTFTTTVYPTPISLKGMLPSSNSPPPHSSTTATLWTLYNRAARAFLHRDLSLTHSLIESAFAVIHPPGTAPDVLVDQRRKWDILRITLESTVYSSPPASHDALPPSLRASLVETPQALLAALYTRSLTLFTPNDGSLRSTNGNAAFLPSRVLVTLIYSSLKLDCPDVGRTIIEDWISRRDPSAPLSPPGDSAHDDGYEKALELYCLQILPKLHQWEYAQEFLQYEGELSYVSRENIKRSLKSLHAEAMSLQHSSQTPSLPNSSSSSPRPYSPTPSSSSSSSSLSTTSTHTVVPSNHRGAYLTPSPPVPNIPSSASTISLSSNSTATPRQATGQPKLRSRTTNSSSTSYSATHLPRSHPQSATLRPPNLGTYALIKASLNPYMTAPNLSTFFLLFVVFPLLSFVVRARHRKRQGLINRPIGSDTLSNVDKVRRRLQVSSGNTGLFGRAWDEIVRAILDTVKMAGSGLV